MYNGEERVVEVKAVEDTHTSKGRPSGAVIITPTGWINLRIVKEVLGIVQM